MKKTILSLLGVLVASAMPGSGLKAQQTVDVDIQVRTLDRAALRSASIYQADLETFYFVDSNHLDHAWSGVAVWIDTLTSQALTTNGFSVSGTVDGTAYANSFIVAADTNDVYYVLGIGDRQQRDSGVFKASEMFASVSGGTFSTVMPAMAYKLGTTPCVARDAEGFSFSTFAKALNCSEPQAVIDFVDTVECVLPVSLTHSLTVNQNGFPLVSSFAMPGLALVTVGEGQSLVWNGDADHDSILCPTTAAELFRVESGSLTLSRTYVNSGSTVVACTGEGNVTLDSCALNVAGSDAAVAIHDNGTVLANGTTCGGVMFASFADAGIFSIDEASDASNSALIDANAFFRADGMRTYARSLQVAAAGATDTVFLARNSAASLADTIFSPVVVDLSGDTVMGTLCIANATGIVSVRNGVVNAITGDATNEGTIIVDGLDSVGSLSASHLTVTIVDGRIHVLTPETGADVTIMNGKYTQNLTPYLAPRHVMMSNPDADNASFGYKVFEGYAVTFDNYNGRKGLAGYTDSVAVVNTEDNRIVPAPGRPSYVGADTVFSAYFVDAAYTTPWSFLHDQLNSDTTLYAKWTVKTVTDGICKVRHFYEDTIAGNYSCDSIVNVLPFTASLVVDAVERDGFTPDTNGYDIVFDRDTVLDFYYSRNTYAMTFVMHTDTVVDSVMFGRKVVYPASHRTGYTLTHWMPIVNFMPSADAISRAYYVQNVYPVTWNAMDTTKVYDGQDADLLVATFVGDDGETDTCLLSYVTATNDTVNAVRTVGVYNVLARPADTNYHLDPAQIRANMYITPAPIVNVTGTSVAIVKQFDGNADATVNIAGTPAPVYGNDDVTVSAIAFYDNADTGSNKTVSVTYTLGGADSYNYYMETATVVYSPSGRIVPLLLLNPDQGVNGIEADANGYCSGDASSVSYYLLDANVTVDRYLLTYSDEAKAQGFADVTTWTPITTPGSIDLIIPADAATGDYTATLTLGNSQYLQFPSAPISVKFHVNLSRNYIKPIFSDVISIVDTDPNHHIDQSSIQWYHNGVLVGSGPYYQEINDDKKLTGSYYVTLTMDGEENRTCVQNDVETLVAEAVEAQVSVVAYPNPVVDRLGISIENSRNVEHSLRVMNVLGVTLVNTSFTGASTEVDFSSFGVGSYTVCVDGTVVRVIKK